MDKIFRCRGCGERTIGSPVLCEECLEEFCVGCGKRLNPCPHCQDTLWCDSCYAEPGSSCPRCNGNLDGKVIQVGFRMSHAC